MYEKQYSNGAWVEVEPERVDEFLDKVLQYEKHLSTFINIDALGRELCITADAIVAYLETGKKLSWADEWYAQIRKSPTQSPEIEVELVKCSCGHTIPKSQAMNASMGTSCPDCYDRMSA